MGDDAASRVPFGRTAEREDQGAGGFRIARPECGGNGQHEFSNLFRRIGADIGMPTLLMDEVDALFNGKSQVAEEIRGLFNAGYRRGAMVGRCVIVGKTVETVESPSFCAVALAGLGWLPDTARIVCNSQTLRSQACERGKNKHSE